MLDFPFAPNLRIRVFVDLVYFLMLIPTLKVLLGVNTSKVSLPFSVFKGLQSFPMVTLGRNWALINFFPFSDQRQLEKKIKSRKKGHCLKKSFIQPRALVASSLSLPKPAYSPKNLVNRETNTVPISRVLFEVKMRASLATLFSSLCAQPALYFPN